MNSITTTCPSCAQSLKVDASMIGRKGRCEVCQTKFIIEETRVEEAVEAAEPASKQKASSLPLNRAVLWFLCVLLLAVGGFWMNSKSQKPGLAEVAVEKSENRKLPEAEKPVVPPPAGTAAPVETPVVVPAAPKEAATPPEVAENVPVDAPPTKEAPPAQTEEPPTPNDAPRVQTESPPAPAGSFPVKVAFERIDIGEYRRTYPAVNQGWMPNGEDQAEQAKAWGNYLGPLGVRIRSHVPQHQSRPAFAKIIPYNIQAEDGSLGLTAAEVVQIAPGSPAENHLQLGDLIIGIEGEVLQSGNQYRPGWTFMHKDARELQLMFGEKIDQAQARGDIRFTVLRFPEGEQQRLPVRRQELWSGEGGNNSVGLQSFDIEVPGEGFITLESNQFDDAIHGDGTVWLDVTIEGDYGTMNLLELPAGAMRAGYGKPRLQTGQPYTLKGKEYAQALDLHAQGAATWRLPEGTKRIKGSFAALSYGKVQPKVFHTNLALPLTGLHRDRLVDVRFPIGKTGSFSATYPKDCAKTAITVKRHTEWLAAQQREDGSWPRLAGYTRDGWDTAWCGLALMSDGDPKYDEAVRKAAYRIAYEDAPSEWTAERAMRLMFLSEYYLRTKDAEIVPGIQAAYHQLLDCCKTDHMAGHKVNGFGYGTAGQHYGTGHLSLAIALASRTPITVDSTLVNSIIQHAGEVCVNGTYAYGRGRRMARNDSRQHGGGNAMSGPGLLGVQIGGGHRSAIQEMVERMDASIGDGDNSHATSSLAFIFSSLAIAAADEEVFLKHMQNFRYKLTLDDNWEGGFLKSAFPLDFQGGEGVTAEWIRSAGSILVLNALKKNLAITGRKELWSKESIPTVAVSEWGGQVHSYYLRNWCLAAELLGRRAPNELWSGIKAIRALPRTTGMVPGTRAIVLKHAPGLIRKIAADRSLDKAQRAHAIELISGLDFQIHDRMNGSDQQVDLQINLPLHQLNWLDEDKSTMFSNSPFPLRTKVEIKADNLAEPILFETEGTQDFDLDQGTRKLSARRPLKDAGRAQFDGSATISFKIGATTVTYDRPLKFNEEFAHSNNYNLRRMKLRLSMAPRAYYQSQPLVIAGIPFDCMYPAERMLEVQGPGNGDQVNIHEGDEVIVDIASENFICPWVHSLEFDQSSQVTLFKPRSEKSIRGSVNGNKAGLYDFDPSTSCDFVSEGSKSIIEYDFGKEVTLNGLDANYGGSCFIRVWYQDGETWIPLVWDNYSVNTSHHPTFPDTKAALWRLEIKHGSPMKFQTLRFYHNSNLISKRGALPQSEHPKCLPPIQPQ